jgi:hypothetical protein
MLSIVDWWRYMRLFALRSLNIKQAVAVGQLGEELQQG